MKRKLIITITILSLLFSIIPYSIVNAAAVETPTFAVESVVKQEGSSTVNVDINVQNNPGIAGATLNVEFADGLTLVAAENGEAFSNLVLTKPGTFTNHSRFLWDSVDGEAVGDGIILTLTFEVSSDATGDLDVCISCNDGDVYNENLDTVEVQTVNGVVKTSSQSAPSESNEPVFEVVSATKSDASSTVNVDIVVKNNPGIAGATLNVEFADGLTLVAAENGEAFSSLMLTKPGVFTNHCRFLWDSVDGEAAADGVILTLTFEVASGASEDLAISIYCNDGDVYNENLDTVEVQTVNGVVKTSSQGEPSESDDPMFEVISESIVNSSSTVSVDIVVKNNPGIAGATLNVEYAEGLTLLSVSNGAAFSALTLTTPGQFSSPCRFLWDSISGQSETNGVILTLTFGVRDSTTGSLFVQISCNDGDIYNENLDTVYMKTKSGVVSITDGNYLFAKNGTTAKVDHGNRFITGLQAKLSSLDTFVFVSDGCEMRYSSPIGTGSTVYVKQANITIETYTVIIFGDVNGDGVYDGQDSLIVNCLANGLLKREQVGEAKWLAADCNHDGEISSSDVLLLEQAGLLLENVDQTASQEELLQSDSYMEYLNLIDQNPNVKETTENPIDEPTEPAAKTLIERIIEIVKTFIIFVRNLFPKI